VSAAPSARLLIVATALAGALLVHRAAAGEANSELATPTWKNVAVAIAAPLEAWKADLARAGEPLATALAKKLQTRTGIQQLTGIDRTRPAGVVLQTDGINLAPVAFVPVTNAAALLQSIAPLVGEATPIDALPSGEAAELWKIGRREWTGYVRRRGDWLYAAQTLALLEDASLPKLEAILPAGRAAGEGDEPPDFSLRVYWQNMPEVLRTWAIDRVRQTMREAAEGESRPRLRQLYTSWFIERLLSDVDEVRLSWTYTAQGAARLQASASLLSDSPLGTFAVALAQPVNTEAFQQPVLTGQEVATVHVCVPPLEAARAKLAANAHSQIATITGAAIERPAPAEPCGFCDAVARLAGGHFQASLWWVGQRPPTQAVMATRGLEPDALRHLLAAAVNPGAARATQAADATLEVGRDGWLGRAIAPPGTDGGQPLHVLLRENGTVCYALLSHDSRRLAQAIADAQAVQGGNGKSRPLVDAVVRTGAALRLASMVAEDWQAKANLGKVSLVVPPEKDRLHVTAAAADRTLRLRVEVDPGLTQAAGFGLALWLLAE